MKTGALLDELLNSDAVWKVDILGKNIVALFSRNNEVVLEVSVNLHPDDPAPLGRI